MTAHATRIKSSVANSRIVRWITASSTYRTARAIARAPQYALVTRLLRVLARWTRSSYLFRWLTKEPDPEVIVIDLRDTYTVGPFIAILDWIITVLEPAYRRSRLQTAGAQVARGGAWLADTRPGRFMVGALGPSDPPQARSDAATENSERTQQQPTDDGFQFPDR